MGNKNGKNKALFITQAAMIAALYVVLTWVANTLGLANGVIQVRFSEALCVLPVFTTAAIPGLFVGCLISNIINGCVIWDIVFGSIATLLGAVGTYYLRKTKFIFTLPPVIANMAIVPFVLQYAYKVEDAYWFLVVTVGVGEVISVCIIGFILKKVLDKNKRVVFGNEN